MTCTENTATANSANWPAKLEDLPLFLVPQHLAALLNCSKRTLERERCVGGGIPFVKHGRRIYYARDVVLAELRKRMYASTAEAKRAEWERCE